MITGLVFRLRRGWHFLLSRYLVTSSIPLLIANVITLLLGLTRNILLTNLLDKSGYGAINYIAIWLPLFALLGMSGFDIAIGQYVAKGHWQAVGKGLRRRLAYSLIPVIVLLGFAFLGAHLGQELVPSRLWLVTALFFPTAQVLSAVGYVLNGAKRFRALAVYYVGQSSAFIVAAAIGLWIWPDDALTGIILWQWLLLSVLNVVFWLSLNRSPGESRPLAESEWTQFFRFGRHMTGISAIGVVQGRVGGLLIGTLVSLVALADYAIGDLFFRQLKRLWTIYYGVSYPRILGLSSEDRWRQVWREMRLATPAFVLISLATAAVLTLIVPWLFSAKYISSLPYVWVLIGAFVVTVPGGFAEMYFRLEEREWALYRIRVVAAVAGVALPVVFLIIWGPLGAAAGRLVANLLFSVFGCVLFRKCQAIM